MIRNRRAGRHAVKTTAAGWCLLSLLFFTAVVISGRKIGEKDLSPKYRDWLKLVSYILLPAERDVFMKLAADRDRDIFIEAFWKQRDPTPETPQNEFRDEHLKRFQYANSNLNRGTPREGWMTDMGRMHIILGAPTSIERFDSAYGIHPCQVWYYYGDTAKGPAGILRPRLFPERGRRGVQAVQPRLGRADQPDRRQPRNRRDECRAGLCENQGRGAHSRRPSPSLSFPGDIPYRFTPSPRNNIILSQIFESPKKNVNPSYATHFLNYNGVVSTEYLTNYIESATTVAVIRDPLLGSDLRPFLHRSPKKMSDRLLRAAGTLLLQLQAQRQPPPRGSTVVFQYSRDFPFYFPPDQLPNIRGNGVSVLDLFPVAEGKYGLTILLQKTRSEGIFDLRKDGRRPGRPDTPSKCAPHPRL